MKWEDIIGEEEARKIPYYAMGVDHVILPEGKKAEHYDYGSEEYTNTKDFDDLRELMGHQNGEENQDVIAVDFKNKARK